MLQRYGNEYGIVKVRLIAVECTAIHITDIGATKQHEPRLVEHSFDDRLTH